MSITVQIRTLEFGFVDFNRKLTRAEPYRVRFFSVHGFFISADYFHSQTIRLSDFSIPSFFCKLSEFILSFSTCANGTKPF